MRINQDTELVKKMTKLKLPLGIHDFKEIVENNYYFIDKTLFIKEVIELGSKVLLFTRPRRFGKTINMSMLHYFLSGKNENVVPSLFHNTLINEDSAFCARYQNKFPVIFITFKGLKENNYIDAENAIRGLVSRLYRELAPELESTLSGIDLRTYISLKEKKSDKDDLRYSLAYLCQYYFQHTGKNVYLLIDEYDSPITAAYVHGYYDEMINLMKGLLGEALKDNKYLAKGIVTGITRVSQESIFSGFNNPDSYSLLREKYGQYFGFTEAEVVTLLKQDGQPDNLAHIKEWYNGYQIGAYTLYNPWSILNCVNQNYRYQPYWINTSDNALIKEIIEARKPSIRGNLITMLQGGKIQRPLKEDLVFTRLKSSQEAIWSLLHASGYLNAPEGATAPYGADIALSIPNKEVDYFYSDIVKHWFTDTLGDSAYNELAASLTSGDIKSLKKIISSYLLESGSFFDFNANTPEQVFHTFMLGLVVGLRNSYIIKSNREAGFGRYDLTLIPKDKSSQGIILEFKAAAKETELILKAEEGLSQIKDKKYTSVLSQHGLQRALLIGLAFHGRKLEVAHELKTTQDSKT